MSKFKVDGGASRNNLLMHFQADILGVEVLRPSVTETTAFGASALAGQAVGHWDNIDHLRAIWQVDRRFEPSAPHESVDKVKRGWREAIGRTLTSGKHE